MADSQFRLEKRDDPGPWLDVNAPQPAPRPSNQAPVWPQVMDQVRDIRGRLIDDPNNAHRVALLDCVIQEMADRDKMGRAKYGVALTPGDGRDSAVDLYQELLDAAVYARKLAIEKPSLKNSMLADDLVFLIIKVRRSMMES